MFISTLIFNVVKFVAIVAVAVAGVFVGKALRERKDRKNSQKEQ